MVGQAPTYTPPKMFGDPWVEARPNQFRVFSTISNNKFKA
jgi:hypothetical protein